MQLRILDDIVQTVSTIHRLCRVIARHDADLSRQMKRAIVNESVSTPVRASPRAAAIAPFASRAP